MNNDEFSRQAVVQEAMSWLRTPYHHAARVKGAGVDCLMLLAGVYTAVGLIAPPEIPYYPQDVMFHRGEETYLAGLMRYAHEVVHPHPGDVAIWKIGRIFSHAAIVTQWPEIIHAYRPEGQVTRGLGNSGDLADRQVKFYSLWGK